MFRADNNYIRYSYDHFRQSRQGKLVGKFYGLKMEILDRQLEKAEVVTQQLNTSQPTEGLAKLVQKLTSSTNIVSEMYSAAGTSEGFVITSGASAGLEKSGATTLGSAATKIKKSSDSTRTANKWLEKASDSSAALKLVTETIITYIAGAPLESEILDKLYHNIPLDAAEKQLINHLIKNGTKVGITKAEKEKIRKGIPQLLRAIRALDKINPKQSASQIKNIMLAASIANTKAHNALAGLAGEAAGAWAATLAEKEIIEMLKGLDIQIDSVIASTSGMKQSPNYKRDPAFAELIGPAANQKSVGTSAQKGDVEYTFTQNGATFSFAASIKQTSGKTLENRGVNLLDTTFFNALDMFFRESGMTGSSTDMLNTIMNVAAAHSAKDSDENMIIKTPESVASHEWSLIKETIAMSAFYYALAGQNKDPNIKTLYLIINNKPFLISDIIKKVVASKNKKDARVSLGAYHMPRQRYVDFNAYDPGEDVGKAAFRRSRRTEAEIINSWRSQKINITFQMMNDLVK